MACNWEVEFQMGFETQEQAQKVLEEVLGGGMIGQGLLSDFAGSGAELYFLGISEDKSNWLPGCTVLCGGECPSRFICLNNAEKFFEELKLGASKNGAALTGIVIAFYNHFDNAAYFFTDKMSPVAQKKAAVDCRAYSNVWADDDEGAKQAEQTFMKISGDFDNCVWAVQLESSALDKGKTFWEKPAEISGGMLKKTMLNFRTFSGKQDRQEAKLMEDARRIMQHFEFPASERKSCNRLLMIKNGEIVWITDGKSGEEW